MNFFQKEYSKYQKKIGKKIGPSNWIEITQNKIDQFAKLTQDTQFIHTDPIKTKKKSPFGKTIAHGFFILSFASKFALDVLPNIKKNEVRINYGFDKVRFISPVFVNSKIRGVFNLKSIEIKNNSSLLKTYELLIEIKDFEKPAIVANWNILNQFSNQVKLKK
tara:strand:+ start:55 stop:543 length:489 start_codon:yes stop_codon:yes gene_type:complete